MRSRTLLPTSLPVGGPPTDSIGADRAAASLTGKPFWVKTQPEPIYGVLHMPRSAGAVRLAALILPPFGWDNDCSYRARRDWATTLAESGVAAARIDFPGTENSAGSPLAPGRARSWVAATADAARWLREESGCQRLVAIGIGLGGMVAYEAAASSAPIDDLVLWATRASGRAYLRELRAYATVASGERADAPEVAREDGAIGIAGHLVSAETAQALSAFDLAKLSLHHAQGRRVLLIGRDAHGIDHKLRDHLERSGAELTLLESDDYHRLIALPELRQTPAKTISACIEWLRAPSAKGLEPIVHTQTRPAPGTSGSVEFSHHGARIRELTCELHTSAGRLTGVVTEPTGTTRAPYCLVLINAGELRHTGPNRIPVEIARLAAAIGVPAARFDLPGLGDSDGDSVRTFERTFEHDAEALAVIAEIYGHLAGLGVAQRFVPVGLCLGAYIAIRAVLEDPRSIGAISINPPAFRWTSLQQTTLRSGLALIAPDVIAPASRHSRLPGPVQAVVGRIERSWRAFELSARRRLARWEVLWRITRRAGTAHTTQTLDLLARRGARVLLLLSEDESVLRLLEQPKLAKRLAGYPTIEVERLPTRDHILRSLAGQEAALARISVALRGSAPLDERVPVRGRGVGR